MATGGVGEGPDILAIFQQAQSAQKTGGPVIQGRISRRRMLTAMADSRKHADVVAQRASSTAQRIVAGQAQPATGKTVREQFQARCKKYSEDHTKALARKNDLTKELQDLEKEKQKFEHQAAQYVKMRQKTIDALKNRGFTNEGNINRYISLQESHFEIKLDETETGLDSKVPDKDLEILEKNKIPYLRLKSIEEKIKSQILLIEESENTIKGLEKGRKQLSSLAKSIRTWQDFEHLSVNEQREFREAHKRVMTGPGWSFGYDKAERSALDTSQKRVKTLLKWRENSEIILKDPQSSPAQKKSVLRKFQNLHLYPYEGATDPNQKRFNAFLKKVSDDVTSQLKRMDQKDTMPSQLSSGVDMVEFNVFKNDLSDAFQEKQLPAKDDFNKYHFLAFQENNLYRIVGAT